MNKHPAIDKWAQKKYELPAGTEVTIEQETRSGGYCETCWYSEEVMVVYANGKEIDTLYTDLASILTEILDSTR